MKINLTNSSGRGSLGRAMVAATLLLSGVLSSLAQPNSPVGTWDCVMSGRRDGLALITFSGDGSPGSTFTGFEILVPKARHNTQGRGERDSRDILDTQNGNTNKVHMFGSQLITGPWSFDSEGRTIGFFTEETSEMTCVTNVSVTSLIVTNGDGSTTVTSSTNLIVDCSQTVNELSFVAKVVPGKRLSLVCSTPVGKINYRGVPEVALTNISGNWYGIKKGKASGGQTFTEFFSLNSFGGFNDTYDLSGVGPGYTFTGNALFSAQKKLAIVYGTDPLADEVLAVTGSFNPKSGKGPA